MGRFGPNKPLSRAKIYLENEEFNKAKSELQTLIDKHPVSQQAIEAKQLLDIADNGIKQKKLAEEKATFLGWISRNIVLYFKHYSRRVLVQ